MKNEMNLRTPMFKPNNIKILMIIGGVLLVLALIGMSITLSKPAQVTQKTALVSYTQTSQFNYTIDLNPSYLYGPAPTTPVTATQYPQAVVGNIAFTYSFKPTAANASGTAWVEAVLENPSIWQKTLQLISSTITSGNFTLDFSLDTQQASQIFKAIADETGITASSEDIILNAYYQSGANTSVQSLPITIENNLIKIPNSLSLTQDAGSGQFAYNINPVVPATQTTTVQGTQTTTESYPSFNLLTQTPVNTTVAPPVLGPGQIAFVNLIDKMDVNFGYQFQANKTVQNLSESVDIVATLAVPQSWSKNFDLLQATKSGNFNLDFPIDVAGYFQLVKSIISETGVNSDSYNLTITANIHATGGTQFGPINENFSPTMSGTITGGVLTWNQNLTDNKADAISQTKNVDSTSFGLPFSAARILFILLSCIFAGLFLGLVVTYFRSHGPAPSDVNHELQKIQKKYGARIAESMGNSYIEGETPISMNSMDDLIKIADELGKPVVHQSSGPAWEVQSYYVIDGYTRYQYSIPMDKSGQQTDDNAEEITTEPPQD
jgi:hypothetical protein